MPAESKTIGTSYISHGVTSAAIVPFALYCAIPIGIAGVFTKAVDAVDSLIHLEKPKLDLKGLGANFSAIAIGSTFVATSNIAINALGGDKNFAALAAAVTFIHAATGLACTAAEHIADKKGYMPVVESKLKI